MCWALSLLKASRDAGQDGTGSLCVRCPVSSLSRALGPLTPAGTSLTLCHFACIGGLHKPQQGACSGGDNKFH